jgi:hypothetical protein
VPRSVRIEPEHATGARKLVELVVEAAYAASTAGSFGAFGSARRTAVTAST